MHRRIVRFAVLLLCSISVCILAEPSPAIKPAFRTLTSARSVHDLSSDEAVRHYPVHLQAVCIVCFTGWHGFFVNDGAGGIYVETKNQVLLTPEIHPGTLLDIEGVAGHGEFAPIIDQAYLRILGESSIPAPRPVSLDRLSTGIDDGQWVEIEGTVRSVDSRDSMTVLQVASGRVQVEVMTLSNRLLEQQRLIGAHVRVDGTVGPILNQRRQIVGVTIYSPNADAIKILQPAPADPFSIPLQNLRHVFDYVPGAGPDHMVRIHGVVSASAGNTVFITDGHHGASVLSIQISNLAPGDLVDAVGFPVLGESSHTIEDARFRRMGKIPVPPPQLINVKDGLAGDFEGSLVSIKGRLVEQQSGSDKYTLLLDSNGTVFSAILPASNGKITQALLDGSIVELTGVCVISETQAVRHFRVAKAFESYCGRPTT